MQGFEKLSCCGAILGCDECGDSLAPVFENLVQVNQGEPYEASRRLIGE